MNPIRSFKKQTGIVKVLFGTLAVALVILCYAVYHYSKINSAEDPRIIEAKELLRKYEKGLESNQYGEAMSILNGMERIYRMTPGYEKSYEIGVILNNKASVYLVQLETSLLEDEKIDRDKMLETLNEAEAFTRDAVTIYENWLSSMGSLSPDEIKRKIEPVFDPNDPALKEVNVGDVLNKRINDIVLAQVETKRRLSVTYTNLGVISRYKGKLQEAKEYYQKAIALWDRNYTAQDNLNILMNKPIEKRSMINRLFPPERTEDLPN
jgi:tetratricopeptide (TPR) repeat protein